MTTHALVPVKSLDAAKSRLAPLLGLEERQALVLAMLRDLLRALHATPQIDAVTVLTSDTRVASVAARAGALIARDTARELNSALGEAAAMLHGNGVQSALIVFADVPLATPSELGMLTQAQNGLVLGAARDGGTNALLSPLPLLVPLMFGVSSGARYLHAAQQFGIRASVVRAAGLAFDVDLPKDVLELAHTNSTTEAARVAQRLIQSCAAPCLEF